MVKIEYYRIFMKFPVIPGRKSTPSNSREFPGIPEREFPGIPEREFPVARAWLLNIHIEESSRIRNKKNFIGVALYS
jgi:hypothetical protein